MRKPGNLSPLDSLPLHVKATLQGWLTTGGAHGHGLTYQEAKRKMLAEFGVKIGTGALSNFFRRHHSPRPSAPTATNDVVDSQDRHEVTIVITLRNQISMHSQHRHTSAASPTK